MSDYQTIEVGALRRGFAVIAKADGSPITTGTVNYYLKCLSGANAGKWYRNSDSTWQVAETANPMTNESADGNWSMTLTNSPFTSVTFYVEYVRESGDLHIPASRWLKSENTPVADSSRRVDVGSLAGIAQTARDIGASVLLSSGTATGQIALTAGAVTAAATQAFNNTGQTTNLPTAMILNSDVNAGGNTSSTLNLANSASPLAGAYVGCVVVSGGQARRIVGYTGASSYTAQIAPNWQTTPSNGAAYFVIADSRSDLGTVFGTAITTSTLGVLDVNVKNINNVAAATPGAAGGILIAGSNAATTFATLTSTGAFSINGVSTVAQTGDSFPRIGANGANLTAIGDTRVANLDVAVSTRMATFTLPTNFSTLSIDGSGRTLLQPTQTGVTIPLVTTTTNLTNLPAIPANWITSTGITAGALNGKGDWITTLGANAPANWINAAAIAATALNGKGDWNTIAPDNTTIGTINTTTGTINTGMTKLLKAGTVVGTDFVFSVPALQNAPAGGGGGGSSASAIDALLSLNHGSGSWGLQGVPPLNVTIVSSVAESGTLLTLVTGDDYSTAAGQTLQWTSSSWSDFVNGDIVTAEFVSVATEEVIPTLDAVLATIVQATGQKIVQLDLTAAQTALFTIPSGKQFSLGDYRFVLYRTRAGTVTTLALGGVKVYAGKI